MSSTLLLSRPAEVITLIDESQYASRAFSIGGVVAAAPAAARNFSCRSTTLDMPNSRLGLVETGVPVPKISASGKSAIREDRCFFEFSG